MILPKVWKNKKRNVVLFNSYEFIYVFLPIVFFGYFWLNKAHLSDVSKLWMIGASLFFYSWWNIVYLPLILGSILFNFAIGLAILKLDNILIYKENIFRRALLIVGIISNVLLLGYFKYTDFFISNINVIFGTNWSLLHILLPLGISFFTFTQIAYLIDVYGRKVREVNFWNYMLFVTFFPHLLAGPILHHQEMMPQFDSLKKKIINYKNLVIGLFLLSIGLFKKVVIADTFARWANYGFATNNALDFFEAWTTSLSYTFQLYFDFSGYSDMALGIALLFNIHLPINFNSPYKALDIQDFWRRWHITLSRFLRDYIYIPLGGNQGGSMRTYFHLFIVFLIGGLWHGASWMFIIWGALHGLAIVMHRIWKQINSHMNVFLAWFITFNFVNISWVFFRAKEWKDAKNIFLGMFGVNGIVIDKEYYKFFSFLPEIGMSFGKSSLSTFSIFCIILGFIITLRFQNSMELISIIKYKSKILYTWLYLFLAISYMIIVSSKSEFLYFNF